MAKKHMKHKEHKKHDKKESHSKAAMKHADVPGAGAKKRAKIKNPKKKIATVMEEFKHGTLHSGKSEKPVSNPKQAIAIALSEAGKSKNKSSKKK